MPHQSFDVEYTDTFCGDANYSWVDRYVVTVPELTAYGYTGSADGSYAKADKAQWREIMRKAKAACGLTGRRGKTYLNGDSAEFRPYRMATVMFITWRDE